MWWWSGHAQSWLFIFFFFNQLKEGGESLTSIRAEDAMVARQTSKKKKTMIYFTNKSEENSKWKFPPTDPDSSRWLLHDYDVLISRIS